MKPEEVLSNIDIHEGAKAADFGPGAGYFTIPLAKRVGRRGVVYAVDVQESALESVRGRASLFSIRNIETIRGNLEKEKGSGLESGSINLVLLANILFQSKSKNAILKEAKRVLKKNGKIVIIEWNDEIAMGPNPDLRISKESLKDLAKKEGLVLEKEFNAGSNHYGLVFSL